MTFSLFGGVQDSEHNNVSFVEESNMSVMQNDFGDGGARFGRVQQLPNQGLESSANGAVERAFLFFH